VYVQSVVETHVAAKVLGTAIRAAKKTASKNALIDSLYLPHGALFPAPHVRIVHVEASVFVH
jgi:hypothetical protein